MTSQQKSPRDRHPLSVSQLNRQAKQLLEGSFPSIWVEGELSNFARPSSGHWYFSLKDSRAQVRCAMFRSANARLRFTPEAGQQVQLRARLSLYEARGDYQLLVEHMEPAGAGALAAAFEALKEKLQAEGLFDSDLKQPLPSLPRHIAVITSPTGAAIQDILTVLARRFPSIPVTLIPVPVQGEGAAADIAAAIKLANQLVQDEQLDFDVILTGRGGGSLEDLWSFNEEIVARAIAGSRLPVVSAVGHEVDFTIADFVADARAATPSAAAELLSPDQRELEENFAAYEHLLGQQVLRKAAHLRQRLQWLQQRLRHPGSRLRDHQQRLDELELRLRNSWRRQQKHRLQQLALARANLRHASPHRQIHSLRPRIDNLQHRLQQQATRTLERRQQQLHGLTQLLESVSPLATLNRGYSITMDENNNVIRLASEVSPGQTLVTRLAGGTLHSKVERTSDT